MSILTVYISNLLEGNRQEALIFFTYEYSTVDHTQPASAVPRLSLASCKVSILFDLFSYVDVRVQSNPFVY